MLATIATALGGKLFESFFSNVRGALEDYRQGKISMEELAVRMKEGLMKSFTQVEVAHADLTARTFESFHVTLRSSAQMQTAWCWLVYTELFVLFWHQFCIPLIVMLVRIWVTNWNYPSSGSTVEWSYALLAFLFGAGAMLLRAGPGTGTNIVDNLKRLVGK